jgi:F-type H+-transporting ATPase subunit alpha
MVHGQRHGRADHLRRSFQARRGLSPGVAGPQAPVGPRSVSRRRVLSAQPPARTQRARREKYGNGSLTALPIIETQAGDVSAYIPTNVISITDGQIYLETDLFYQGMRPGDFRRLVRVARRFGGADQGDETGAGRIKGDLAQFRELAAFAQFGSDLDAKTQAQLERGKRIVEVVQAAAIQSDAVEVQAAMLWTVQNNFMDDVPVDKIKDFQAKLTDYLDQPQGGLMAKFRKRRPSATRCRRS